MSEPHLKAEPQPMAFIALKKKFTPQENLKHVRPEEKETPWSSAREGETSNSLQCKFSQSTLRYIGQYIHCGIVTGCKELVTN